MDRIQLTINDNTSDPLWVVTYYLGESEFDDDLDDSSKIEAELHAPDFNYAVRYAEQYLRKKSIEDTSWKDAEILSIELY